MLRLTPASTIRYDLHHSMAVKPGYKLYLIVKPQDPIPVQAGYDDSSHENSINIIALSKRSTCHVDDDLEWRIPNSVEISVKSRYSSNTQAPTFKNSLYFGHSTAIQYQLHTVSKKRQ